MGASDTLNGTVAWLTGAGSGIGQAGALELARSGATVILSGRREAVLAESAARIREAGIPAARVDTIALDVSDAGRVADAGKAVLARHGRIDILVNSAGTNVPRRRFHQLVASDWDRVVRGNLDGALYCMLAVLPSMRERKSGLVINISSWLGRWPGYLAGPAYAASKHGMAAMTHQLNMEEGLHGIRGCVIYPGEVATPILASRPKPPSAEELARMLRPEDLGRLIRFVAESPAHVCLNEIVITPTWNRMYIGGDDLEIAPNRHA